MTPRKWIGTAVAIMVVAVLLVLAFRPSPIAVNVTDVRQGHFAETVEDEGKTRLRDPYRVSAPIGGFLRRVVLEPGDEVAAGDVVFELEALPTPALDARAREQAREQVSAARARLESAEAERDSRQTQYRLAQTEAARAENLHERGAISTEERDRRLSARDASGAAERAAQHAVEVARFELEAARATLEVADGERARSDQPSLQVRAPASGVVTRRERCCEGPVQAGEVILEIGDFSTLEVQVDVLSMDAVRIAPGMSVIIEQAGLETALQGRVRRVEPAGFTRVSALGVDEQRVPVWVSLESPREAWQRLGDGFRVEARFVLWEGDDVVQMPSSALFRDEGEWQVFLVEDGRAVQRPVTPGRRSGLWTEIRAGVEAGETVITHPGDRIREGIRVAPDVRNWR